MISAYIVRKLDIEELTRHDNSDRMSFGQSADFRRPSPFVSDLRALFGESELCDGLELPNRFMNMHPRGSENVSKSIM